MTEQNNKLHRYKRKIKKQSQEKAELSRDLQAAIDQSSFPEREELVNNVRQLGMQLTHALKQLADKQDAESKLIDQTNELNDKVKVLTADNSHLQQKIMTLQRS